MITADKKVVVITGSARGIGLGLAMQFSRLGHAVVLSDISAEDLQAALQSLPLPSQAATLACDVCDPEQLASLWRFAAEHFGRIDLWINNAGVGSDQSMIADTDPALLARVIDTNVKGVVFGTQVALRGMSEQGYGAIYNTAGFGSNGFWRPGMTIYGTSKRAVAYFTKGVAGENKHSPVQVCWLNPGMVVTPLVIEEARIMPADQWATGRTVFNMFAETVETTSIELVGRILSNDRSGINIHLLPSWKMAWKALRSIVVKRDLFGEHGV